MELKVHRGIAYEDDSSDKDDDIVDPRVEIIGEEDEQRGQYPFIDINFFEAEADEKRESKLLDAGIKDQLDPKIEIIPKNIEEFY